MNMFVRMDYLYKKDDSQLIWKINHTPLLDNGPVNSLIISFMLLDKLAIHV